MVIKPCRIRNTDKIYSSITNIQEIPEVSIEESLCEIEDNVQEVSKPPEIKTKKEYMAKKKEAKVKKNKDISEEKEEENFRIKVTPDQIKYIISKVDKAVKNMFEKVAANLKMKEEDIEFIYEKRKEYMKILDSGKKK